MGFYGITFLELVRFFMQVGLALAGAAALWGLIIAWRMPRLGIRDRVGSEVLVYFLGRLFGLGFSLFLASWLLAFFSVFIPSVFAHEGITIRNIPAAFIQDGFTVSFPVLLVATAIAAAGFLLFWERRELFLRFSKEFFLSAFLLVSVLMYLVTYTGGFGRDQMFYFFHNWHSILTLGTVLVVDSLYISTKRHEACRRVLYRVFPWMSAAIWIGLGIDFINNTLIFDQHDWALPVFLYTQIIVAIIVINGTLLSRRINEALIKLIGADGRVGEFGKTTERIVSFSGAVSIVSWLTITFSDGFTLTVPAWAYFGLWGLLIGIVYAARGPLHRLIDARLRIPDHEKALDTS